MQITFVVINYGDNSVGEIGYEGRVKFDVDDGIEDSDYEKDNIRAIKKLLKEIYGGEFPVDIYTEDEYESMLENEEDWADDPLTPNETDDNDGYPEPMLEFKLNNNANAVGTSKQAEYVTSYKVLDQLFGETAETDHYKISTIWVFESTEGDVVTLYDWKATNLYDPHNPSVEEFRQEFDWHWHIGAMSPRIAQAFIKWLKEQ
jgi:hypothetical protein